MKKKNVLLLLLIVIMSSCDYVGSRYYYTENGLESETVTMGKEILGIYNKGTKRHLFTCD